MEPENPPASEATKITNQESWYSPLTKVTPLSKYLALALFIVSPILGFWFGFSYVRHIGIIENQENVEEATNFIEDKEQLFIETDQVILSLLKEISDKYDYMTSEPSEDKFVWLENSVELGIKHLDLAGYSIQTMDFSLSDTDAEYGRTVIRLDKEIFDLLRSEGFAESPENETDHPTNQSSTRGFYNNSNGIACLRIIEDSESEFSGYSISCAQKVDNQNILDKYSINENGELIKQLENGEIVALVRYGEDISEKVNVDYMGEKTTYKKGKVLSFLVSPDGKYIVYRIQEGLTGCCGGPWDKPAERLMVMNSAGKNKILVSTTPHGGSRIGLSGWLANSKNFVFYDQHMDEATQGSRFYSGSIGTSSVIIFESIEMAGPPWTVALAEPYFSPTEDKFVYRPNGILGDELVLKDMNDNSSKVLLTLTSGENMEIQWSKDGETFQVILYKGNKILSFDKEGNVL